MELKYITATQIADEQGVKTAAITTLLGENGLLTSGNELRKWDLTDKAIALGARYSKTKEGKAGSGKSTFIQYFTRPATRNHLAKNYSSYKRSSAASIKPKNDLIYFLSKKRSN